jgi:regulator of RNase E activity RraA
MNTDKYIVELRKKQNNSGNVSDAIEEITGVRGWMVADMKPIFKKKIVGRAVTVEMRPLLNNDIRKYKNNNALEIIDIAGKDQVLVYVMKDGLNVAAMGDLMATAAKTRGIEGAVIDGAVRDTEQLETMKFPVWSRRVSPATMVGRMVSTEIQVPVTCGEVLVMPGDYLICDSDGVVVIPQKIIQEVIEKLKIYSKKEKQIIQYILEFKSIIKAISKINRY